MQLRILCFSLIVFVVFVFFLTSLVTKVSFLKNI